MLRIAAASIFLTILLPASEAPADPNYAVWLCAHERMVANWRRAEPRCGWTVGGYTCSKAVLSSAAFLKATPYNQAFYDSMKIVRDFWATPEYAELLSELNDNVYPYVVNDKGTAQQALDGVVKDWTATFNKYHRYK